MSKLETYHEGDVRPTQTGRTASAYEFRKDIGRARDQYYDDWKHRMGAALHTLSTQDDRMARRLSL